MTAPARKLSDMYGAHKQPADNVQPQRVHIVDDDPAVRDSVAMLLDAVGLDHVAWPSASEFLDSDVPQPGDMAVMDIRMPGIDGLEAQKLLNERGSNMPLVFITGHGDIPMAVNAMKRGAGNFLRKPFRDQELIDSVTAALEKAKQDKVSDAEISSIAKREASLTPREREVFHRVASGQANKVVAIELGISERTVEVHRSQIMKKMQVRSLAELVNCRFKLGEVN